MYHVIIDKRLNPSGKSAGNRQRLLRRAKASFSQAVHDAVVKRDVSDILGGGEVHISPGGISEPTLHRGRDGVQDYVLPGNDRYAVGDVIDRSPGGGGGGGREGATDGSGEDAFRFVLSPEEFTELFMSDLALPDMSKRKAISVDSYGIRRAGYSIVGSPANMSIPRTCRMALSRRIALGRPSEERLAELETELESTDDDSRVIELRGRIAEMKAKRMSVPYIDPLDARYRRFEKFSKPSAQAVVFCLMDVSASMGEREKDLAKRFYMLLYVFLKRQYDRVDVVFIRHTHEAAEVDEDTFFNSQETGGTVVSSAFVEMKRIIKARYNPDVWNIYGAQASDGDNSSGDNPTVVELVSELLPDIQYFAYLEVNSGNDSALWYTYAKFNEGSRRKIAMKHVADRSEIWSVFRDLFRKRSSESAAA